MKKVFIKNKLLLALSTFMFFSSVVLYPFSSPQTAEAWECKDRNVIRCGVSDRQDLASKIINGDGTHTDIKSIFEKIGIYPDDILSKDTVGGIVKKDGTVWVGSQQVASGVVMGERSSAGVGGTPFAGLAWNFVPATWDPQVEQVGAYVYMYKGSFKYAVILSCGNPVLSSLNAIPPHLIIEKTVRNTTANPSSAFTKSANANPGDTVEFKARVVSDGQVTAEHVNIGDYLPSTMTLVSGSAKVTVAKLVNGSWQIVTINYADAELASGRDIGNLQPGQDAVLTFSAKVSTTLTGCNTLVNTAFADSSQTSPITDKANVVVCSQGPPPPPPSPPPTPQGQPTVAAAAVPSGALPVSGPVEAAAGVMGTGAIGYAGYMWRRSRRHLLDTLKKK